MAELRIKDFVVLVDDEDYEHVMQCIWRIMSNGNGYYRAVTGRGALPLSRFILNASKNDKRVVDHINGNPLDNRKNNLRLVPREINNLNSSRSRNASLISVTPSGFCVRAGNAGRIYIGHFKTKEEADAMAQRFKQTREKQNTNLR